MMAGLETVKLLKEPVASAIAYGVDVQADQTVLVFDLGGGTLDVSILEVGGGVIEVRFRSPRSIQSSSPANMAASAPTCLHGAGLPLVRLYYAAAVPRSLVVGAERPWKPPQPWASTRHHGGPRCAGASKYL